MSILSPWMFFCDNFFIIIPSLVNSQSIFRSGNACSILDKMVLDGLLVTELKYPFDIPDVLSKADIAIFFNLQYAKTLSLNVI